MDSTYTQSGTYSYNTTTSGNNYSMSFDGVDDYIQINQPLNSNNFTWLIAVNQSSNSNDDYIIDSRGVNTGAFITYSPSGIEFGIKDNNISYYNCTSFNLQSNQWDYIVLVKESNYLKLYIEGVIVDSIIVPSNINYNSLHSLGQRYSSGNGHEWNGLMDNFSVWSSALSQQEIQQYMNCPPTGTEAGLVGYWNFEEGTGNTAYDQTSNGNDGTINGATYDTNVPPQSCTLTNANGCDSTAILNLTINQGDTSYTNITACDSVVWNGTTYDSSGTYSYSSGGSNNYSMSFDGVDDYVEAPSISNYDTIRHNLTLLVG